MFKARKSFLYHMVALCKVYVYGATGVSLWGGGLIFGVCLWGEKCTFMGAKVYRYGAFPGDPLSI